MTSRRGTVCIEIVPWLSEYFGVAGGARLVFEEEVDADVRLGDLLVALRDRHPGLGASIGDFVAGELFDHVTVIHNDTVVGADAALDETIVAGDSLVFLPAFSGG